MVDNNKHNKNKIEENIEGAGISSHIAVMEVDDRDIMCDVGKEDDYIENQTSPMSTLKNFYHSTVAVIIIIIIIIIIM